MILVVLAAGLGSRYGGTKQLDVVGNNNETIIDFSIYDAIESGFKKVVFVVREEILEEIKNRFVAKLKHKVIIEFVCQELDDIPSDFIDNNRLKPWGTAHALLVAKKVVDANFCVINADDFYGLDAFNKMVEFLKNTDKNSFNFSMVGYHLENTLSENGSVSRGECYVDLNSYLQKVEERTSIFKKDNSIFYNQDNDEVQLKSNTIVSMNFWGFTPLIFKEIESQFHDFLIENYHSEKKEFYLPSVVNHLIKNKIARVKVLKTTSNWMGVTYKKDKENVVSNIKKMKEKKIYPEKLWS